MSHLESRPRLVAALTIVLALCLPRAAGAFQVGYLELSGDALVTGPESEIDGFHCPFIGPPKVTDDGPPPLGGDCSGVTEFDESAGGVGLFIRAHLDENRIESEVLASLAVGADPEHFDAAAGGITLVIGNETLTFHRTLPVQSGPGTVEYRLGVQGELTGNALLNVDFNQTSTDDAQPSTIEEQFELTGATGLGNRVLGVSGPVTFGVPHDVDIRMTSTAATEELSGSYALTTLRLCGFTFRDDLGLPIDDVVVESGSGFVYPLDDCGSPDPTPTPTATPQPTETPVPSPTVTPAGPVIGAPCTLLPEFLPITCPLVAIHDEVSGLPGISGIEGRLFREIDRAVRQARQTETLCEAHRTIRTRNALGRLARRLSRFSGLLHKRAARRVLSQAQIDDWNARATDAQAAARDLRLHLGEIFGLCADLPNME